MDLFNFLTLIGGLSLFLFGMSILGQALERRADDSSEAAKLLKIIGDYERIADHAVGIIRSAEELTGKEMELSQQAILMQKTPAKAGAFL